MKKIQLAALSKLANEQASRIDELEEKLADIILSIHGMRRENISFDKYLRTLEKDKEDA
jgi:hypothetical protein